MHLFYAFFNMKNVSLFVTDSVLGAAVLGDNERRINHNIMLLKATVKNIF